MAYIPPVNPRQFMEEAGLKIKEEERKRDLAMYPGDTSNTAQRKRLPRGTFVLLQFTILLLIIVGIVILYHFLH